MIPQQQFLMIAVLLKLFVFPHQPFVRVLQEATFLFQAYFAGRLDRVALPQTQIEVEKIDGRGRL